MQGPDGRSAFPIPHWVTSGEWTLAGTALVNRFLTKKVELEEFMAGRSARDAAAT